MIEENPAIALVRQQFKAASTQAAETLSVVLQKAFEDTLINGYKAGVATAAAQVRVFVKMMNERGEYEAAKGLIMLAEAIDNLAKDVSGFSKN